MTYILKALRWAYSDSLAAIAFFVLAFLAVGAVFVFITYPWQVIATVVGCVGLYALYCLVHEYL